MRLKIIQIIIISIITLLLIFAFALSYRKSRQNSIQMPKLSQNKFIPAVVVFFILFYRRPIPSTRNEQN